MSKGAPLTRRKAAKSSELLSQEEGEALRPLQPEGEPAKAEVRPAPLPAGGAAQPRRAGPWAGPESCRARKLPPSPARLPALKPPAALCPSTCSALHATPARSQRLARPACAQKGSLRGEWGAVLLLVALYAIQGVPLGLSMGSM